MEFSLIPVFKKKGNQKSRLLYFQNIYDITNWKENFRRKLLCLDLYALITDSAVSNPESRFIHDIRSEQILLPTLRE